MRVLDGKVGILGSIPGCSTIFFPYHLASYSVDTEGSVTVVTAAGKSNWSCNVI